MKPFALLAAIALTTLNLAAAQTPLDSHRINQFENSLPSISTWPGNRPLTIRMCEARAWVLPPETVPNYAGTAVWTYLVDPDGNTPCAQLAKLYATLGAIGSYIGPVIANQRGTPTQITYVNELGSASTTNVLAYKNSTDQTVHWADPLGDSAQCTNEKSPPAFGSKCAQNYGGPIAAVPHLHGGEVPPEIDGGPEAWFTSDGLHQGARYYSFNVASNTAVFRYPNRQEAAPIWFHDHTLGATRLGVYAGLAGGYLIDDPALQLPANLQQLVIPLVMQDRMFDTDGQLLFPIDAPNPNHPYWVPEFMGDTIVVNGAAWPRFEVEPRRYRFLLLNGSNARPYELSLWSPSRRKAPVPAMWAIATDGGFLDDPVRVAEREPLVMLPGERYEVIIDFSKLRPYSRIQLRNTANAPYPDGDPVDPRTTGKVMEFRVVPCVASNCGADDKSYDPAAGESLRKGSQRIVRLVDPSAGTLAAGVTLALTRQLTLNEIAIDGQRAINPVTGETVDYDGGPLEILLNNTEFMNDNPRPFGDFTSVSETPREGTTELWEIINLTADAHPIHLHLTQMQLMNRQDFNADAYSAAYEAQFPGGKFVQGFGPPLDYRQDRNALSGGKVGGNPDVRPYLAGNPEPPLPQEAGWKDTVIAYPGQVTRLVMRWAPTDLPIDSPATSLVYPFDPSGDGGRFAYVWHCHIIDHEDNEMMRTDTILPSASAPATRTLRKGIDY